MFEATDGFFALFAHTNTIMEAGAKLESTYVKFNLMVFTVFQVTKNRLKTASFRSLQLLQSIL